MPSPTLTRRALIAGAGTTIASAALAVPFSHASQSLGAPAQLLGPEAIEAIAEWNRLQDIAALAWSKWDEREVRAVYCGSDERYLAWFDRRKEASEAQSNMLKLLRFTDLDLGRIYRHA